jgi:hypothetical protein
MRVVECDIKSRNSTGESEHSHIDVSINRGGENEQIDFKIDLQDLTPE